MAEQIYRETGDSAMHGADVQALATAWTGVIDGLRQATLDIAGDYISDEEKEALGVYGQGFWRTHVGVCERLSAKDPAIVPAIFQRLEDTNAEQSRLRDKKARREVRVSVLSGIARAVLDTNPFQRKGR